MEEEHSMLESTDEHHKKPKASLIFSNNPKAPRSGTSSHLKRQPVMANQPPKKTANTYQTSKHNSRENSQDLLTFGQ